jgi:hypothetical protein
MNLRRLSVMIITTVAVFSAVAMYMPKEIVQDLKPYLRFFPVILTILVAATYNIKSRAEAIQNIDNLKSTQISEVRSSTTYFISRIWGIIIFYIFTTIALLFTSFWPFSTDVSLQIANAFCLSLFWLVFLSGLNLMSMDIAITALNGYMKEISLKLKEKQAAIEKLSAKDTFSDEQKEYFAYSLYNEKTAPETEEPQPSGQEIKSVTLSTTEDIGKVMASLLQAIEAGGSVELTAKSHPISRENKPKIRIIT